MSLIDTFFNPDVIMSSLPALLRGFLNTLLLGILSIGIGIPIGLVISLVRLYAPKPLRWLAVGYTDTSASTKSYFAIIMSAYSAEVFRSGIESIPRGQFEASQALGLPFLLTLRKVVLPQAIRVVIPPMTSNCVSMFKDTSLASTVALPELLKEATNAQSLYANPSPLIGAALVYLLFLWPMVRLVSLLERRFQSEKTR